MISCNLRTIGLTRTRLTVLIPSLFLCYLIFRSSSPLPSPDFYADEFDTDDINAGSVPLSNLPPLNHTQVEVEAKPPPPMFCRGNECMRGKWVPREPLFRTLEDFKEVYAKRGGSRWEKCAVGDLPLSAFTKDPIDENTKVDSLSDAEKKRWEEQRIVDVFNWVWQPEGGRKQVEWDAMDFVVRLLKTPGGIVFMGDSVSQGHEHAFGSYLQEAGIEFQMFSMPKSYWALPDQMDDPDAYPSIRSQILTPGHPLTLELQKRAGVPDSRMKRPVFSVVEEHFVIHQDELRRLVGQYGANPDWPWHLQQMRTAKRWLDFIAHLSDPFTGLSEAGREPKRKDKETGVDWDTILVLNTGAHWSRGTMYMIPEAGDLEEQLKRQGSLYRDVVKSITTKLSTPAFSHLSILYRSTSPAHPSCHLNSQPYASHAHALPDTERTRFLELVDATAHDDVDRKIRRRWDWDMFNVHNEVWEEAIRGLQEQRAREERRERMERARDEVVEGLVGDAKARGRMRVGPGEGETLEGEVWAGKGRKAQKKGVAKNREYRRGAEESLDREEEERGESFERRAPAEYKGRGRMGPTWRYVDFYDMSLQRPDAHATPGRDCLHWCMPAVYNEWTRHIYHLLWTEMEGTSGR